MQVLDRNEVISILENSYAAYQKLWLTHIGFMVESLYLKFFVQLASCIPQPADGNILLAIQNLNENSCKDSIVKICKVLEQNSVDGSFIWELINDERLILRKELRRYNHQIPGKSPKGIITELWHDYNHWLTARQLWLGFQNSLLPTYRLTIPFDIGSDLRKIFAPEIRPLWGMYDGYSELGRPIFTGVNLGNAIFLKPWRSLAEYKKNVINPGMDCGK